MTVYTDKVEEKYQLEADTNAEESWKLFKKVVIRAAEEICGTTKGGKHWCPCESDDIVMTAMCAICRGVV